MSVVAGGLRLVDFARVLQSPPDPTNILRDVLTTSSLNHQLVISGSRRRLEDALVIALAAFARRPGFRPVLVAQNALCLNLRQYPPYPPPFSPVNSRLFPQNSLAYFAAMAESKTRNPQSQIPVKASSSRYAQSAMPNTLSSPHFSFAPSSQHLSVSDSPSHQSQNTVPTPANSSGITTFRSFRNLLPFGPTKLPSTSNNPAPSSKSSPFSNLGVIRRSMNGERSVSAPVLRPKKSQEDPPILSIQLSHKVDEPLIKPEDLRGGLGLYMKQPEPPPPPPPQSAPATSQRFQPVGECIRAYLATFIVTLSIF